MRIGGRKVCNCLRGFLDFNKRKSSLDSYHINLVLIYLTLLQLFSQLTNWFMFFCFNRTLSNSLETVLTLASLYYWPCISVVPTRISKVSRKLALFMAALSCGIRPTSAITWLYVGLLELFSANDRLRFIFLEAAPIGYVLYNIFNFLFLVHK